MLARTAHLECRPAGQADCQYGQTVETASLLGIHTGISVIQGALLVT